jgi:hypothetical protein
MPVNLNALIRYKTIDECLSNLNLKCTIDVLIDRCSEKLAEYQGVYSGISERTIRNDIRILRSDILGFNAPIIIEDGIYSYDDINFTIFGRPIKELELLKEVQELIVKNFNYFDNKEDYVYNILVELSKITDVELPQKPNINESKDGIFSSRSRRMHVQPYSNNLINWGTIFNTLRFTNYF